MNKYCYLTELSESPQTDFGKRDFAEQQYEQQVFSAVWELDSQVRRRSFDRYLSNLGNRAPVVKFAPTALRVIGANQCATIVEKALGLFPTPLPDDADARWDLLDVLPDELVEKIAELDRAYSECFDDLTELLFAFVAAHPGAFGPVLYRDATKIYGVRIYPKSLKGVGGRSPIFLHGSVQNGMTDFYYIFRVMESLWKGRFVGLTFGIGLNHDPMESLREAYGQSLCDAFLESQTMILRGDGFPIWGPKEDFWEGASLPIFDSPPPHSLLKRLYWSRNYQLSPDTWPTELRAVVTMWDDIFWELYSPDKADVEALVRAHQGDPKLEMYWVSLDPDGPAPRSELAPAIV